MLCILLASLTCSLEIRVFRTSSVTGALSGRLSSAIRITFSEPPFQVTLPLCTGPVAISDICTACTSETHTENVLLMGADSSRKGVRLSELNLRNDAIGFTALCYSPDDKMLLPFELSQGSVLAETVRIFTEVDNNDVHLTVEPKRMGTLYGTMMEPMRKARKYRLPDAIDDYLKEFSNFTLDIRVTDGMWELPKETGLGASIKLVPFGFEGASTAIAAAVGDKTKTSEGESGTKDG